LPFTLSSLYTDLSAFEKQSGPDQTKPNRTAPSATAS